MELDLEVFYSISYGMYVLSSFDGEKLNGQINNTIFQATAEPIQLAVCVSKNNFTYNLIRNSKVFTISALSTETPMTFLGLFGFKSGRDINKFETTKYKIGITGAPIVLDYTISYFECELVNEFDVGTHVIFVGKAVDAQFIKEGELMTYTYYRDVRHGLSPKNAPTFHKKKDQ